MGQAIRNVLNREAVSWMADRLSAAHPPFDKESFIEAACHGLEALELKQRSAHIAACMGRYLPPHFPDAAHIVARSLGPVVEATGENGLSVLRYFPHDNFIEQFGIDHPVAAYALQAEVTQRASCEFSIRAFLVRHPDKTYAQLMAWAKSDNAHLRRLASEGSRPRLPWGQRLKLFVSDPGPVIALLEILKDDPVRYVQRSVANSINDISKDHPDLAADLCARWNKEPHDSRRWIVRHALRDLVKKGHPGALRILGGGGKPQVSITNIKLSPTRLTVGGKLDFRFSLTSTAKSSQEMIVDYVIHYVKANGKLSPKVFKLARISLTGGESRQLHSKVSFADLTTRKHRPGLHKLSLQVNGQVLDVAQFELHAD